MTDAELVAALDDANEAIFAELTRRTPGGQVVRQEGLLLVIGSDPSPVIVNSIVPVEPDVEPGAIDRALARFNAIGHHTSVVTRDHVDAHLEPALTARGFRKLLDLPGMILESRPEPEPPPPDVEIRRVDEEADRVAWLEANLYGFAEDEGDRGALRSAFQTLESLTGGPVASFYAVADGRPVAAGMVYVDETIGMGIVGWIGTIPEYRRRGIGRSVTLASTIAGFDLGARVVGLQSSPMGLPVYLKLGFRTIAGYKVWFPPAS